MLKSVPKYSYFNSQWKIPYIPEREQFLKKSTYDNMTAFLQFIFIKSIFSKKITTQQNQTTKQKKTTNIPNPDIMNSTFYTKALSC